MLEVLEPGLLTTVQDAGRPDWTHLGAPIGGACDGWSLAVANLLAGNAPSLAVVEMTLVGATFAVRAPITIGLAGADLGGLVRESGRPLPPGRTHRLDGGTTIAFAGDTASGTAREYLALPGGIDVPLVLGSASTALGAGFGGVDGRRLEPGDVLRGGSAVRAAADADDAAGVDTVWPTLADDPIAEAAPDNPIRVLPGPANGLSAIVSAEWRVGAGSDRVGLRLEGPPIAATEVRKSREGGEGSELLSHGVVLGAIQVPAGGAPIILLADHQTTGGYPIAAVVITADHPRLGQLRPGASVRFKATTIEEARVALGRRREALARGAASLREVAGWDDLWQFAGG